MKKISFYSSSFQGRRKNNEDSCIAIQLDANHILLAVADGMGGAAAGEVASKTAIEVLQKHLMACIHDVNETTDFKSIISEGFLKIQEAIRHKIQEYPEYKGMGTTLSLIWLYKNQYIWANLGDSRIYFLNQKMIKQITKDHTYIQDFEDKHGEQLPPEIAAQYGNYIMRSLDGGDDVPDIFPLNKPFEILSDDSAFLLCSDGLIPDKSGNPDEHFLSIFRSKKSLKQAGEALIKFAYDKGSTDNITVVLAEFGRIKRKLKVLPPKTIKTILIVLITLAIIFTGGLFLNNTKLIPVKYIKSSDSNIPDSLQSATEFNQENTVEPDYPPYNPFPRKIANQNFKLSIPESITFSPYEGIPEENIDYYEVLIDGLTVDEIKNGNVLEIILNSDINIDINKLNSGNKKYELSVKVVTKKGHEIHGKNPRTIKITP